MIYHLYQKVSKPTAIDLSLVLISATNLIPAFPNPKICPMLWTWCLRPNDSTVFLNIIF